MDTATIRRTIAEIERRGAVPKEIRMCRTMVKSVQAEFRRLGLLRKATKVNGAFLYGLKIIEDPTVPKGEVWILQQKR